MLITGKCRKNVTCTFPAFGKIAKKDAKTKADEVPRKRFLEDQRAKQMNVLLFQCGGGGGGGGPVHAGWLGSPLYASRVWEATRGWRG